VTGAEVLALAASHGVRVTLALGDLRLEADHEPLAKALVALRDHKEAVVAELRRAAGEWRRIFERHVARVMRIRGLPRIEAERAAYEVVLVEFLNIAHPDTPSNRCAHCGRPETPGATLQPIGWGARHTWLHNDCWEQWRTGRRVKAEDELARLGIVKP
jgi:hypothetical protein